MRLVLAAIDHIILATVRTVQLVTEVVQASGAVTYVVNFVTAIAPGIAAAKAFCWAESALAWALTKAGTPTSQPEPEAGLCLLLGP
jgi:hypothetical protein